MLRLALPLVLALAAAALAGEAGDDAALRAALREEAAGLAGDTPSNGEMIGAIASALARLGDLEGATRTAGLLDDRGLSRALLAIAVAQARAGDTQGATRTATSLPYRVDIVEACLAAARASPVTAAAEACLLCAHQAALGARPGFRARGLVGIALCRRERGDAAAARALVPAAVSAAAVEEDALIRSDAFARIGVARARLGEVDLARAAFEQACAAARAYGGESPEENRAIRLRVVAVAEAEVGLLDDALALATTLTAEMGFARDQAIDEIVHARVAAGDLDGAARSVLSVELRTTGLRDTLLAQIAGACSRRGDLARAATLTARIEGRTRRAQATLDRCTALARLGRNEEALALAATIDLAWDPAEVGARDAESARRLVEAHRFSALRPETWTTFYELRLSDSNAQTVRQAGMAGDLAAAALRFHVARGAGPIDEAALGAEDQFLAPREKLCAARASEGDVQGALAWARRWGAGRKDSWVPRERAQAVLAVAEAVLAAREAGRSPR